MDLFFFSSGIFLSSITDNSLIWVDYIYILSNTIDLTRSRNCLPLTFTLLHSQFLVGSLLLIFTVFGGVLVAHLYSFWWGPCCSSLQLSVGSLLLILTVFGGVLVAHLYSFCWGPCCSTLQFSVLYCVSFTIVCHCPVFCAPNVASVSGLLILGYPLGFILPLLDI